MNQDLFHFSLGVFTAFFAVMNPIANTPIFQGLTEGLDHKEKKKIALRSTLTAFIIVVLFTILGKQIFDLFDITIPAFKITGGIIIFYVGFEMLLSKKSKVSNNDDNNDHADPSISPLAIPILAGPGTIVTAMNHVTEASLAHLTIVVGVFALMILLTYLAFVLSDKIVQKIGTNLITVLSKIMGLILAILGTGMVITGLKLAFNI